MVRVLVVEDDEGDIELINRLFRRMERAEYEVEFALTKADAASRIRQQKFDVVIVDEGLPDAAGTDLIRTAQTSSSYLPFIMLTGMHSEELEVRAILAGATDFLIKQQLTAPELERSIHVAFIKKIAETRLRNAATLDALTGLLNRGHFEDRCALEMARIQRRKSVLSMLVIDLDDFKQINDQYGHVAGDTVLQVLANLIQDELRQIDLVGRYGGDEFVALLPDTSGQQALITAERLQQCAAETIIEYRGTSLQVAMSIGIAATGDDVKDFNDLFHAADTAVLQAKQQGRNCCVLWQGQ